MNRILALSVATTSIAAVAMAAGPAPSIGTARPAQRFTIRAVDVPIGFSSASPNAVNAIGEAVGSASGSNGSKPIVNIAGVTFMLETLGGLNNYANAINEAGQIAGVSQSQPWWGNKAVRWETDGSITVIMPLTGDANDNSYANGINNLGHVAGQTDVAIPNGMWHAFYWSEETGAIDLGTLGGSYSGANDINDNDVVVGWSWTNSIGEGAFVWQPGGTMTALPTLAGSDLPGAEANAINNHNEVVGHSNGETYGIQLAVLWDDKGNIHNLGTLGGHSSWANDINDAGTIVGEALLEDGTRHAFLFENGRMKDLNDMLPPNSGWVLQRATGISEDGTIVGTGQHNGVFKGFVMEPRTCSRSVNAK